MGDRRLGELASFNGDVRSHQRIGIAIGMKGLHGLRHADGDANLYSDCNAERDSNRYA